MTRLLLALCAAVLALAPRSAHAERPPNIVIILADDLGYADIGAHGGTLAPTPHIDSLARDGVRFQTAYAASPVCAVSRAGLLTGKNPTRIGIEHNPITPSFARALADRGAGGLHPGRLLDVPAASVPPTAQQGLPPGEVTLAEMLRARGYATGIFGKWHLGAAPEMRPERQGFDVHVGFYGGGARYMPEGTPGYRETLLPWSTIDNFINSFVRPDLVRNGEPYPSQGYMTDLLVREATDFIRANAQQPFFTYVPLFAPHTPIQTPEAYYARFAHIADPTARGYAALVATLDDAVGRILAALDEAGLRDDTIVIFSSDNGGPDYVGISDINAPLRGWKATFLEGGVRVPMLVRWPGRAPAGRVSRQVVSHLDLVPTLTAIVGATAPADVDGLDLAPALRGDRRVAQRTLFWRSGHYRAVRDGRYKLITSQDPPKVWLFDLARDPGERTNLAARRPRVVERLQGLLAAQETRLVAPLWPSLVRLPVYYDYTERQRPPADAEYVYWGG